MLIRSYVHLAINALIDIEAIQECLAIAVHSPQDTIHESTGAFPTERLGQFDGLIDGYFRRSVIIHQDLIGTQSDDIAIDRGYLIDRPFWRDLVDDRI